MTARTPSRRVPLAAQSRDEPVPYSLPAKITSGVPDFWNAMAASYMAMTSPLGPRVKPPSTPGTIWFLMRILAKVPRIITS